MNETKTYQPEPLAYERPTPEAALAASRAFLSSMMRRRTVRHFSLEPVPDELIENAIRAAASAPSGANQQPWTFLWVRDAALKRQIRAAAEAEERRSYEGRMSEEWLQALAPLGTDWRKPMLEEAPALIVVFRQAYGITRDEAGEERHVKHYYSEESVGIAVGFLLASLQLAGLATLTHTPSPMRFLGELLGRPANERAFVLIPVGYPAADAVVPRITKKALADVLVRK